MMMMRLLRRLPVLLAATALCTAPAHAQHVIDIMHEPFERVTPGMTSTNIAIHGVRLRMDWEEARVILERANVPYLFSKSLPLTVYVPPAEPSVYFTLHPASYEIIEMGVVGPGSLHPQNRLLANLQHWRLTTARTWFFGGEGHYVLNEEGSSYDYPGLGFTLKCLSNGEFRFVMLPVGPRPVDRPVSYAVDIPFFVTGYYRPNTAANLRDLRNRMARGDFRASPFIGVNDTDYASLNADVERQLASIEHGLMEHIRYLAQSAGREYLVIAVTGFHDPRPLRPGRYTERTVETLHGPIVSGSRMEGEDGNKILAALRAVYTAEEIEERLSSRSPEYAALKRAGRIVYCCSGDGVGQPSGPYLHMRSIEIKPILTARPDCPH